MMQKNRSKASVLFFAPAIAAAIFSCIVLPAHAEKKGTDKEEFRKPFMGEAKMLPDATFAYVGVESYPRYEGKMTTWLKNNWQPAATRGNKGVAVIAFAVTAEGKVASPYILKSSGNTILDNEALRLVSILPDWTPGTLNGHAVRAYSTLTISFTKEGIEGGGC